MAGRRGNVFLDSPFQRTLGDFRGGKSPDIFLAIEIGSIVAISYGRNNSENWASALARNHHTLLHQECPSGRRLPGRFGARQSTEPNCPVVGVSIGTYSFRYWHAFGVDDAAISHKQSLARAKSCSQCGSLFLSTNGSFLMSAEDGTNLGSETTRKGCFGTKHPHDLRNRTGGLESAFPNPRNPRNPRLIKPR